MALGIKFFRLNRKDDFEESGVFYGMDFEDDFFVKPSRGEEKGFFISRAFDSKVFGTWWNRIKVQTDFPENAFIKIYVYSSDDKKVFIRNFAEEYPDGLSIEEYLMDESNSMENKKAFIIEAGGRLYDNCDDIPLFRFNGRYLWILLEVENYSEEKAYIKEVKIEFPKKSFVEYLPEIYQKDDGDDFFFQRFLGVFQSLYLDLDDKISDIPRIFDPQAVTPEFLDSLVDLMSVPHASLWGEKRLRVLLKEVISLYKIKGTIGAVSRVVELFTGEVPIIIEKISIEEKEVYRNYKNKIDNLFGENGYFFSVFVSRNAVREVNSYANLLKIIDDFKPIDAICNLVVLNDEIHLDYHCYVGINSNISGNQYMLCKDATTIGCTESVMV